MTKRTDLVLFGSLSAASDMLEYLLQEPRFRLLGVVCRDDDARHAGERYAIDIARENTVPVLELDSLPEADLGLSVRFDKVLRQHHLDRFRIGIVNLHGAPLPDMRGSRCESAAIMEMRDHFGTSLHFVDSGIDTGPIVSVERFPIPKDATAGSLLREANRRGIGLLQEKLRDIAAGNVETSPQKRSDGRTYTEREVEALCRPGPSDTSALRERKARAAYYGKAPRKRPGILARIYARLPLPRQFKGI